MTFSLQDQKTIILKKNLCLNKNEHFCKKLYKTVKFHRVNMFLCCLYTCIPTLASSVTPSVYLSLYSYTRSRMHRGVLKWRVRQTEEMMYYCSVNMQSRWSRDDLWYQQKSIEIDPKTNIGKTNITFITAALATKAVSYTHLDVYKRQMYD